MAGLRLTCVAAGGTPSVRRAPPRRSGGVGGRLASRKDTLARERRTAVPYATWFLFYRAQRTQYALLITFVLFWVFGYWGIAGPLLSLARIRSIFRAIEHAKTREEIFAVLHSDAARDAAIDHIASEYRIPRVFAARVVKMVAKRIGSQSSPSESVVFSESNSHE